MNLITLSEDALLHVLGFLGTRDLLQCRGVCRRLRDSALHPHLWRHRVLFGSSCVQLVAATLRMAPCLGSLSVDLKNDGYLQLGTLLVSTNCATSNLRMHCDCRSAVSAAMALVRQAALGRLRTVSLTLVPSTETSDLRLVLDQLLHTRGLTSIALEVLGSLAATPLLGLAKAAKGDAVPASLTRLESYGWPDGALLSYFQWHAETLQVVLLGREQLPANTAAVLAALPNLRQLTCPFLDNMPALLRCPALASLDLYVDMDRSTRPLLRGVQTYLRQAVVGDRLQSLTLHYDEDGTAAVSADAANLVLCLAGPGANTEPSTLRSLSLTFSDDCAWMAQPQLPPLATVLHGLDSLVSLDLACPHTADLLEAMNGRALPRLERLRVHLKDHHCWGEPRCPHEWAHGDEPRALLRRYPRLHIEVSSWDPDGFIGCEACDHLGCDECPCGYCEANNCHDFRGLGIDHVLFGHSEQDPCSQDHGTAVAFRIEL